MPVSAANSTVHEYQPRTPPNGKETPMTDASTDTAPAATAPFLTAWFEILDSDEPNRILDLISDDFSLSILFSTGDGDATDFAGDRAALVRYLEQRERGTRT